MGPCAGVEDRVSPSPVSPRGRPGRWGEVGIVVVALAAAVGLGTIWSRARAPGPGPGARDFEVMRPAVATPAPHFALPDLAGRLVRLEDARGRVVLLNFWATWCPPCLRELPAIRAVEREFGERGLVVLAINYREPPELVRSFAREHGLGVRVLLDRYGEVSERYRVAGLPTTVLVDRTGLVAGSAVGYRNWDGHAARAYLRELLAAERRATQTLTEFVRVAHHTKQSALSPGSGRRAPDPEIFAMAGWECSPGASDHPVQSTRAILWGRYETRAGRRR